MSHAVQSKLMPNIKREDLKIQPPELAQVEVEPEATTPPEKAAIKSVIRTGLQNEAKYLAKVYLNSAAFSASHYQGISVDAAKMKASPMSEIVQKLFNVFLSSQVLVTCFEGKIIAFGILSLKRAWIEGLYVEPSFFRKKIGSDLLAYMEKKARDSELKYLRLASSLFAEDFFLKAGYEYEENIRKEHNMQSAGIRLKSVNMKKNL